MTCTMVRTCCIETVIMFTVFTSISRVTITFIGVVYDLTCSMIRTVLIIAIISYLTVFAHKHFVAIARITFNTIGAVSIITTVLPKTMINNFTVPTFEPVITTTYISIVK